MGNGVLGGAIPSIPSILSILSTEWGGVDEVDPVDQVDKDKQTGIPQSARRQSCLVRSFLR